MLTRTGWYVRVAALWVVTIGVAAGLSYIVTRLIPTAFVRDALDFIIWGITGAALYGNWRYTSRCEPTAAQSDSVR